MSRKTTLIARIVRRLDEEDAVDLYERLTNWRRQMDWLQRDLEHSLEELREYRFAGGVRCPRCGSEEVHKWGKRNGKQRYRCRADDCGRTFNDFTETPFAHTRRSWAKWAQYVECMLDGKPLRQCAEEVGITLRTSFRWRHVVLDALRQLDDETELSGLVEADETYVRHSKKGENNLPRPPRERGESAPLPGISHFLDCVLTAQDRRGNRYAEYICQAKPQHDDVEDALRPRITPDATGLCSDGEDAYAAFCEEVGLEHHPCDSHQPADAPGEAHLGHINNFHSLLKRWMRRFNGVASKYRNHYLSWFVFHREASEDFSRTGAWQELLTRTALADP